MAIYIKKSRGLARCIIGPQIDAKGTISSFSAAISPLQIRDWIEVLLEYASQPNSGMVGARIDDAESGGTPIGTLPDLTDLSPEYYARFFL